MSSATIEQLAKVQSILEQLDYAQPRAAGENRRRASRINVRIPLTVTLLGALNPAPISIFSRNISVSGIGFVSRRMFKPGERIVIQLRGKGLSSKLILARITFSRYATGGHYDSGAEFLESLEDNGHAAVPSHWLFITGTTSCKVPARSRA